MKINQELFRPDFHERSALDEGVGELRRDRTRDTNNASAGLSKQAEETAVPGRLVKEVADIFLLLDKRFDRLGDLLYSIGEVLDIC